MNNLTYKVIIQSQNISLLATTILEIDWDCYLTDSATATYNFLSFLNSYCLSELELPTLVISIHLQVILICCSQCANLNQREYSLKRMHQWNHLQYSSFLPKRFYRHLNACRKTSLTYDTKLGESS